MSENRERSRRIITVLVILFAITIAIVASGDSWNLTISPQPSHRQATGSAAELLATIPIKGRAPKTGYTRTQYGDGWAIINGCDMRNIILHRDMQHVAIDATCRVLAGTLNDPYTGKVIQFHRGADSSGDVQIDHVVALSDSWQKGAQQLTREQRRALANDPLELLAVDGPANQAKGDGDAATWLPPNKAFRCQYVARQIAVKAKYKLWVTQSENDAMRQVLSRCPGQILPTARD